MDINMKTLSLDTHKKTVLTGALAYTANFMNKHTRKIYDTTEAQVEKANDRVKLTAGQVEIVKHALENYTQAYGQNGDATAMLAQLTMTRKEFANWSANHKVVHVTIPAEQFAPDEFEV